MPPRHPRPAAALGPCVPSRARCVARVATGIQAEHRGEHPRRRARASAARQGSLIRSDIRGLPRAWGPGARRGGTQSMTPERGPTELATEGPVASASPPPGGSPRTMRAIAGRRRGRRGYMDPGRFTPARRQPSDHACHRGPTAWKAWLHGSRSVHPARRQPSDHACHRGPGAWHAWLQDPGRSTEENTHAAGRGSCRFGKGPSSAQTSAGCLELGAQVRGGG